jgi:hypothetical protein
LATAFFGERLAVVFLAGLVVAFLVFFVAAISLAPLVGHPVKTRLDLPLGRPRREWCSGRFDSVYGSCNYRRRKRSVERRPKAPSNVSDRRVGCNWSNNCRSASRSVRVGKQNGAIFSRSAMPSCVWYKRPNEH